MIEKRIDIRYQFFFSVNICKNYKYKPANYFMFKHCIDKWQNGQHVWYKYGICAQLYNKKEGDKL